jgi:hypothetical protein
MIDVRWWFTQWIHECQLRLGHGYQVLVVLRSSKLNFTRKKIGAKVPQHTLPCNTAKSPLLGC